jgi:serine/threonine-protein kinase
VDRKLDPGALVAGRYRLERVLGEGGMGVVWAATHVHTRRKVALKLVKRAGAEDLRVRLLREARASCAVRHPHVREVYDVLEADDGAPMMVMEHLAGESLADRLEREGKLTLPEAAALLLPVVSAVGAAHALGIVHRDLKPANIFLEEGPPKSVKVLDFGIAKLTASEGDAAATAALTTSGALLGTPYYMSPEQAFGEKDVDHRTDVWALGLILYRCLTGVLPTRADNVGQVFKSIVARPIPPLAQAAPELPADVTTLVDRMLSRARKHRPGDLHEVAAVLERYTDVRPPDFGPVPQAKPEEGEAAPAAGESSVDGAAPVDPLADAEAAGAGETLRSTVEPPIAPPARGVHTVDSVASVSQTGSRAGQRSRAPLLVGVAAVVGLGLAALRLTFVQGRTAPAPTVSEAAASVAPPAAPSATAAASLAPPASATAGPSVEEVRRVHLMVLPRDVMVEVDGERVRADDGMVSISGKLGSVRRVRLSKGKAALEGEVIITEAGAMPPKMDLNAAAKPRGARRPEMVKSFDE